MLRTFSAPIGVDERQPTDDQANEAGTACLRGGEAHANRFGCCEGNDVLSGVLIGHRRGDSGGSAGRAVDRLAREPGSRKVFSTVAASGSARSPEIEAALRRLVP